MRIYAIGDIHGQLEGLRAAHARIAADQARLGDAAAPVVHLGDLVDRGPDSRGVIAFLLDGISGGAPWIVLRGNHDQIFARQLGGAADPGAPFSTWTSEAMGGAATCASYGVEPRTWLGLGGGSARRALAEAVPARHKAFLAGLPLYHATEALLFVHAGIRPGLPLEEQIEEDLVWIRWEFLEDRRDHGRLVVHGHTPVEAPEHRGNRVNLDTGAGYGRPLTAAVFEGRDVWVLEEDGRRPLRPDPGGVQSRW